MQTEQVKKELEQQEIGPLETGPMKGLVRYFSQQNRWHWWVLVAVGLGLFTVQLGNTHLWDQDEGYYATAASEMYARGDWIVPTFNGELFAHKPPMMFWGMMLGYSWFGVSEVGARFVSSLFGLGTILLTYQLARRLLGPLTGLMSGLAIGSCIMFTMVARSATADAHLTFFVLLSLSFWMNAYIGASGSNRDEKLRSIPWFIWLATYSAMGLGVLTKGPIGFLFPMAIIGLFLLLESERPQSQAGMLPNKLAGKRWLRVRNALTPFLPSTFLQTLWRMRPITAAGCILAVAGPWYLWVQSRTQGAFLQEFIGVHHMGRFAGAMDNHSGPIYYYVAACLIGMYPWSAFAIPTTFQIFRDTSSPTHARAMRFLLSWVAVYLVIFSLAGTKLPNYVLPAYPALAIFCGRFFAIWMSDKTNQNAAWMHLGWALLILLGLSIVITLPVLASFPADGPSYFQQLGLDTLSQNRIAELAWVGMPLCVFGLLGWIAFANRKRNLSGLAFALGACAWIGMLCQFVAPQIDRFQGVQRMADRWRQTHQQETSTFATSQDTKAIVILGQFRPSLVFYFGQLVHFIGSHEEAIELAHERSNTMLITTQEHYHALEARLPGHTQVIERVSSLPGQDELVVLDQQPLQR